MIVVPRHTGSVLTGRPVTTVLYVQRQGYLSLSAGGNKDSCEALWLLVITIISVITSGTLARDKKGQVMFLLCMVSAGAASVEARGWLMLLGPAKTACTPTLSF